MLHSFFMWDRDYFDLFWPKIWHFNQIIIFEQSKLLFEILNISLYIDYDERLYKISYFKSRICKDTLVF